MLLSMMSVAGMVLEKLTSSFQEVLGRGTNHTCKIGRVDISQVTSLRDDLQRDCKHEILFTQVWPSKSDSKQVDRLMTYSSFYMYSQ